MDSILRDVKQALRVLGASRGISIAALTSIALGVGGTTAMFSVVYGVLMRPLPYPEPRQLVGMWEVHPGANAPLKQDLTQPSDLPRLGGDVIDTAVNRQLQRRRFQRHQLGCDRARAWCAGDAVTVRRAASRPWPRPVSDGD